MSIVYCIILHTQHLLHRLLSSEFSAAVHELLLLSLGRMMVVEERRLESVAAGDMMQHSGLGAGALGYTNKARSGVDNREVDLSGEVTASDGDSTVSGSILQQHLEDINAFLGHPAPELRIAAVDLIGTSNMYQQL